MRSRAKCPPSRDREHRSMAVRERHRDRGVRRARAALIELGRELREARRALGLRQIDVARAAGVSPSWISRIERGVASEVGLRLLSVILAIVGLDLAVRAFPGASPLRDQGHRDVLSRFRALLPVGAPWRSEVPLPIPGDQRAWDAMTELWGRRVGVEAETGPTDLQALERRTMLKARDGDIDRVITGPRGLEAESGASANRRRESPRVVPSPGTCCCRCAQLECRSWLQPHRPRVTDGVGPCRAAGIPASHVTDRRELPLLPGVLATYTRPISKLPVCLAGKFAAESGRTGWLCA